MTLGEFWNWLTTTNAGLCVRIAFGVGVFATWAYVEFIRKGAKATRWKEYLFLLYCVAAAILFGILNDQVTVSISWEYFVHGKGFDMGNSDYPDFWALRLWSCEVGAKATWTVGLLLGAALLICNNPPRRPPVVPLKRLAKLVLLIAIPACVLAIILGVAGYFGLLTGASEDFTLIWQENLFRPRTFLAVWGMHLGAYAGGALGAIALCAWIIKKRIAGNNFGRISDRRRNCSR